LGGKEYLVGQPTVTHDAKGLIMFAAIRMSPQTGIALAAVDVGFDATPIAYGKILDTFTDRDHFHSQFMAGNARECEKRKSTEVASHVGAADTHAMDTDEHFARSRLPGFGNVDSLPGFNVADL
tara:strand:+ start:444 stop:815 length:372 start_codon:yes stop_codon:yes gene_type:complete